MTPEELDTVGAALDALAAKYFQGQYEELLLAQAELAWRQAKQEQNPDVRACLEAMADALNSAAINCYASDK